MFSVVSEGTFWGVSKYDPNKYGYYVVKYSYNPYTIQYYISIYGILTIGEKVFGCFKRICSIQCYRCYLEPHYGKIQPLVVSMRTVIDSQIEFDFARDC